MTSFELFSALYEEKGGVETNTTVLKLSKAGGNIDQEMKCKQVHRTNPVK